MGYSFRLTARVLLYASSHRQDSTYHGLSCSRCGALAGTRLVVGVWVGFFFFFGGGGYGCLFSVEGDYYLGGGFYVRA